MEWNTDNFDTFSMNFSTQGITNFTSEFRGWFHDHHRAYEKEASKKLEELLAGLVVINEHFTGWKERHQNDHQDDFWSVIFDPNLFGFREHVNIFNLSSSLIVLFLNTFRR